MAIYGLYSHTSFCVCLSVCIDLYVSACLPPKLIDIFLCQNFSAHTCAHWGNDWGPSVGRCPHATLRIHGGPERDAEPLAPREYSPRMSHKCTSCPTAFFGISLKKWGSALPAGSPTFLSWDDARADLTAFLTVKALKQPTCRTA